jgi:hypothetical protein
MALERRDQRASGWKGHWLYVVRLAKMAAVTPAAGSDQSRVPAAPQWQYVSGEV